MTPPPQATDGPATGAPPASAGGGARTAALVLLALVLLLPPIAGRELLPPDEPRFALVAAEMVESGDALLPTRGGEPYLEKPPLLVWGAALGYAALRGPHELAARAPSLLATLVLVALLHRAGRRWLGEPCATAAAVVYLTAPLVFTRAAGASTDPLLALGVLGCVSALSRGAERRPAAGIAAAAWLALGLYAKGPVAAVHVALAAAAAWAAGWRGGPSLRPLARPAPLALLALLVMPWPTLLAWRLGGPLPLAEALWRQTAVRYVRPFDNQEPWWFYAGSLAAGLFPWSLVWPAALASGGRWRRLADDPRWRGLALWTLSAVVFFSLTGGKRNLYLLPVYPALALLVAASLPARGDRAARRFVAAALALAAAALLAAAAILLADPRGLGLVPDDLPAAAAVRFAAIAAALALGGGCALGAAASLRGRSVVLWPAAGLVALSLSAPHTLVPAANEAQGARAFGASLRERLPPGARVASCRGKADLIGFYGRRPLALADSPARASAFLAGPGPAALVCSPDELPDPEAWPSGAAIVLRGRIGRRPLAALAWGGSAARRRARVRE